MLRLEFASVLRVKNSAELLTEAVGFTRRLGLETLSVMVVVDHPEAESDFLKVHNTPPAYAALFRNMDGGRRDPVMQHCKTASIPIIWNQTTYTSLGMGEKWEMQARFGYRTGIALALHLPAGRHFFIGVNRDRDLPRDAVEATRMVAELHLFAAYAQDAALRVLAPSDPSVHMPKLTIRELEVLRWTMEGKTAWEIGRILAISEHTAARHINNAAQKLGCVNKHHAVAKALRIGLIC